MQTDQGPFGDQSAFTEYHQQIPLRSGSQLSLDYTEDPSLDLFYGSLAVFYEAHSRSSEEGILKSFNPESRFRIGLINLPNADGTALSKNQIHSSFEQTLVLASLQLGFYYPHSFLSLDGFMVQLGLRNDVFVRGAYNLADLSPSIESLRDGWPLLQTLAFHSSGMSFATWQYFCSVGFDVGSDMSLFNLSWSCLVTDFLYTDHLMGMAFTVNRSVKLSAAYDFASYDTLNGLRTDALSLGISVERVGGTIALEGQYRSAADWGLTLSANLKIDTPHREPEAFPAEAEEGDGRTALLTKNRDLSPLSAPKRDVPTEKRDEITSARFAGNLAEWNVSLLDRNDLSLIEVAAILVEAQLSFHYDYGRLTTFNFNHMKSPEEYIESGGICRDAANATANILEKNGYESKIVFTKQTKGPPHAFVVTEDEDGSFYLFNYEYIYGCPGADNFLAAAASFSGFLELYLLDPQTHRVTDVVRTPDADYLGRIVGIE
jgi:hypothetical protein